MTLPLTTALVAAILGLLGAFLTARAIATRVSTGVDAGDGGVPAMAQAIRAHANFTEQAPLGLILIGSAEIVGVRPLVVEILGVVLVLARVASAVALSRSLAQGTLRKFGGGVSVLLLAASAVAILLTLAGIS